MTAPAMLRAPGDGVRIQLAHWPGPGPTVLAVHGLTANCRSFDTIAAEIAGPVNLYAVDLRGRGLSDHPSSGYSLERHARDLAAVIGHLGLGRVTVMGHSLGAYITLALAAGHPELVERVILLDGGADLSPEQWARVGAGIAPSVERLGKRFPSPQAYLDAIKAGGFLGAWSQTLEDYYLYDCVEEGGSFGSRVDPAHIAEERASLARTDVAALYPGVRCPVLVLRATRGMLGGDELLIPDEAVPRLMADLPTARVVDVVGSDHFSMVFRPYPSRTRAILEFLGA